MFFRTFTSISLISATALAGDSRPACPGPAFFGAARCHAHIVTDQNGNPKASGGPVGYGPLQFQTAYGLTTEISKGANQTIAIIDAYDHPTIENDLAVYSAQFGLPACTTANGCFRKVDQRGGTNYPRKDAGWALEIALDVEIAHA